MHAVPTRCTRAFTERVISSRSEDKVHPAFLSHITQGLLICFFPAVPTYPYQTPSFQQPSSPASSTDFLSSPCRPPLGKCSPVPHVPGSPAPQFLGSPAPRLCVLVTELLCPVFLIPVLKEGVLSSPSKKLGRRRLSYSIDDWRRVCIWENSISSLSPK